VTDVLYGLDGVQQRERVATLRAQGRFFWLDVSLSETSRDDLRETLGVPERALQTLGRSGDTYASRAVADSESVVFDLCCYVEPAATPPATNHRLRPVKVHAVVTGDYLLTLHEERVPLPSLLDLEPPEERGKGYVVYSVLDMMVASTFSALEEVGLSLDALAASGTDGRGGRVSRATLRETVATLAAMRRWVTAEQAALERSGMEIGALPGFGTDAEPYFDRLGAQVDRLLASIDAAANGMGMLLDLQLNERAYVVSVLATIFVPLTLITGYFGMNFGWMVDRIDSPLAFWLLGFGIPIATGVLAWRLLVRPFLFGDERQPRRR
jgi:magnesium transporter